MQVRDDVISADELASQCEAAIDDVSGRLTMTSGRLDDVTQRADSVVASVEAQLGDSALQAITAVTA